MKNSMGKPRQVLANERLDMKEAREEYEMKIFEELKEATITTGKGEVLMLCLVCL